ncbi:hypothetical protein VTK73DRAFT_6147 [Phialemonium thermophilum]|uniref:Uncharacterized protein n=1 Tax=Phialemonium thermophilum TaxID=223376 RepID=A0ABR3WL85_9PEZI
MLDDTLGIETLLGNVGLLQVFLPHDILGMQSSSWGYRTSEEPADWSEPPGDRQDAHISPNYYGYSTADGSDYSQLQYPQHDPTLFDANLQQTYDFSNALDTDIAAFSAPPAHEPGISDTSGYGQYQTTTAPQPPIQGHQAFATAGYNLAFAETHFPSVQEQGDFGNLDYDQCQVSNNPLFLQDPVAFEPISYAPDQITSIAGLLPEIGASQSAVNPYLHA